MTICFGVKFYGEQRRMVLVVNFCIFVTIRDFFGNFGKGP